MSGNAVATGAETTEAAQILRFTLPNGEELGIQQLGATLAGNVSGGLAPVSMDRLGKIVEGLQQVFAPIAKSALPGKTVLEVNLEISVESGKLIALLADGRAKGNIKMSFEWLRQ